MKEENQMTFSKFYKGLAKDIDEQVSFLEIRGKWAGRLALACFILAVIIGSITYLSM